jgi:hypothetical protein
MTQVFVSHVYALFIRLDTPEAFAGMRSVKNTGFFSPKIASIINYHDNKETENQAGSYITAFAAGDQCE